MVKKAKRLKGFSLIELIVVIFILATLALIITPNLKGRTEQARRTSALLDIRQGIGVALDSYEIDNGEYPSSEQRLKALLEKPNVSPLPNNWSGPYVRSKKKLSDP